MTESSLSEQDTKMLAAWNERSSNPDAEPFSGSANYWEARYAAGGGSGIGSQGKLAAYKAEVINELAGEFGLKSAIEWGCGDGVVLDQFKFAKYTGVDVSETIIANCQKKFAGRNELTFLHDTNAREEYADVALSLDVIFHLIEDGVFENYMRKVFRSARKCVIIYSNNHDDNEGLYGSHVRNRLFTHWIEENINGWRLERRIPNKYPPKDGDYRTGSFSDFYVYLPTEKKLHFMVHFIIREKALSSIHTKLD